MKNYIFLSSVMALLILINACSASVKSDNEESETEVLPEDIVELREDQIQLAQIELGAIEMRSISSIFKVNGIVTTSPHNMASVCSPMGGFVKSLSLIPGNSVVKGQTLAILENQDFVDIQQNYLEAKNKLEFAETEYKRHNELYNNDVYSQQNVQQVTADYKNLKAQVKALEQKLAILGINSSGLSEENISSALPVLSPISGYIKSVNINLGKYVASSDVLFEIINSDQLLLELTVFEKDVDKVAAGQKIRFFINNEAQQHDAAIYQTGRSVGTDKTLKVYARVSGACKNVFPGMYVNAQIETSGRQLAALPTEAIVSFEGKDYIFIFDKNKEEEGKPFTEYKMVPVQKGSSDNGYTEVILPEGYQKDTLRVVVKGAYNLLCAKKNAGEMAC